MDEIRFRYRTPQNEHKPVPQPAQKTNIDKAEPLRQQEQSKPKRRLKRMLSFLIVLVVLAASAGIWAYPRYINKPNPFPAQIQHDAQFSLFYPGKLPSGYSVDPSTMHLSNGVLIYAAANGDQRIVITLQTVPSTFDFATFYKQGLPNSQQIDTPYGQATIGKNGGRYLASLVDGSSWLLLSTNSSAVTQDQLSLVLTHLKKY